MPFPLIPPPLSTNTWKIWPFVLCHFCLRLAPLFLATRYFSRCSTSRKLAFPFLALEKKLRPSSSLFEKFLISRRKKKVKILEIRKIINRASSSFQIKTIRYIPRLSFPFLYNRNNTLRREGNKRKKKKKKKSFVRYFVTVQLFRRPFSSRSCCAQRGSRQFIRSGMQ